MQGQGFKKQAFLKKSIKNTKIISQSSEIACAIHQIAHAIRRIRDAI